MGPGIGIYVCHGRVAAEGGYHIGPPGPQREGGCMRKGFTLIELLVVIAII
ncbi:MAG: type II secretion system protein [Armatimonadetes bacterium]|nr:type II secretion system protein [Armatimonadota bacterium]